MVRMVHLLQTPCLIIQTLDLCMAMHIYNQYRLQILLIMAFLRQLVGPTRHCTEVLRIMGWILQPTFN